jgi:hypothetical protein
VHPYFGTVLLAGQQSSAYFQPLSGKAIPLVGGVDMGTGARRPFSPQMVLSAGNTFVKAQSAGSAGIIEYTHGR